MMNEYIVTYIFITFIIWFIIASFYAKRYKVFVSSFLDSVDNISIISNLKKVVNINEKGLAFFGVSTTSDFNSSYFSVGSLFIEEEGCLGKHDLGRDWLQKISDTKEENIRVKLLNREDKEFYYFNIKVSKIAFSTQYLILFHNITKIIGEKNRVVKLAEHDALTGIYNRVKLNSIFPNLIFNANKYDKNFSIILFDIDHFKSINDIYGHNVGDSVLVELTHLIKNLLRESDIFVRWGGEEFIVVLPITSLSDASKLASHLRKNLEEHPFLQVGEVTCSFGVTDFKVGDTQIILLERADEALYTAKNNGRNQVVTK